MKKQIINKLHLLLKGLENRYDSQQDFFEGMTFQFYSASKIFRGNCSPVEEGQLEMRFLGESKRVDFPGFIELLLGHSINYDRLELYFEERGNQLLIQADDKKVTSKNIEKTSLSKDMGETKARNNYIKPSKAEKLLKVIGIMSEDGKIKNDKIRKLNQIDYFVEVVSPLLEKLADKESITILDSGCGKSYLTFVLNYYIKEELKKNCYFIGVDNKESVIESSRAMAESMGYRNMEFVHEDLRVYTPDRNIDMVISLHACDIATDYAIALGIRAKANSMVIVPCCHKELKDQITNADIEPIIKHGVFRARFNDLLTDSMRALFLESHGYEVSPVEYISPLDTPKNLMIRGIKTSEYNKKAMEDYQALKRLFSVSPTMEKYIY